MVKCVGSAVHPIVIMAESNPEDGQVESTDNKGRLCQGVLGTTPSRSRFPRVWKVVDSEATPVPSHRGSRPTSSLLTQVGSPVLPTIPATEASEMATVGDDVRLIMVAVVGPDYKDPMGSSVVSGGR